MANAITRSGITVPESRFYSFVIFGKIDLYGRVCRIGDSLGNIDEWQGNTDIKWESVVRVTEKYINKMLPHGEDEISIQCGYRNWGESEKGKAWTVKEWQAMLGKLGQGELFGE